jgi:DNA-binding XRE family transcriptional regulator
MDEATDPIASGGLARLREQFSLSLTMQAHLIGVPPHSLAAWERGVMSPSKASMAKVVDWYTGARAMGDTVDPPGLMPLSTASQLLGVGMTTMLDRCRTGALTCVDLGPLGVFVEADEVRA